MSGQQRRRVVHHKKEQPGSSSSHAQPAKIGKTRKMQRSRNDSDDDEETIRMMRAASGREQPTKPTTKSQDSDDDEDETKQYQKQQNDDEEGDIMNNNPLNALLKGSSEIIEQRITFVKAQKADKYDSLLSNMKPINGTSNNVFVYDHKTQNGSSSQQKAENSVSSSQESNDDEIEHNKELDPPTHFLYPREKIIQINSWNEIRKIGPGLNNLGNTCFMNASLQCLMYTPALRNYLLSRKIGDSKKFNALDSMSMLAKKMFADQQQTSSGRVTGRGSSAVSPQMIAGHLKGIGGFILGRQEDSHEFIIKLLDKMENAIVERFKGKMDNMVLETNPVHQIFGGYLRSQIKTQETNYISNKYDAFIDIELQLNNCSSIEKALQNYITPDRLDGKNKYKCPKTNTYVTASKKLTIHEAPINLILNLKRFNIFGKKVSKKVSYEATLDISPYMSNKTSVAKYHLYGVLVHSGGSAHSGHYYSYVKNTNGIWYRMDDSSVTQVSQSAALSQQAYILFYSRENNDFKSESCTTIFQESIRNLTNPDSTSQNNESLNGSTIEEAIPSTPKKKIEEPKPTPIETNNTSAASPVATTEEVKSPRTPNKPTNLVIPSPQSTTKAKKSAEPPSPFYAPIRIDVLGHITPQKLQALKSFKYIPPVNFMKGIGGLTSPISLTQSPNIPAMWYHKNHLDKIIKKERLFRVDTPSTPIKPLIADEGKPQNPFALDNFTSDSPIFSPNQQSSESIFEKKGQKRKTMDESDEEDEAKIPETVVVEKKKISAKDLFSNGQYSEDVDVWDDEDAKTNATKQKAINEKLAPKPFQRDEWDRALDSGKKKKIRKKETAEDWEYSNEAIQRVAERKHRK